MSIYLEKVPLQEGEVCVMRELRVPYMDYPFHCHPEYELIWVKRGHGKRLVGDHIGSFRDGDLVLIGPHLPHQWQNAAVYRAGERTTHALVLHFRLSYLQRFLEIEGHEPVRMLLRDAEQGVFFPEGSSETLESAFRALSQPPSLDKTLTLLKLLARLAQMSERTPLASTGYTAGLKPAGADSINLVFQYLMENYQEEVSIESAAALLSLSKSAFCHYFKKKTSKRFSVFVNELRIGSACRQLIDTDKRIATIAFENGFRNLSYFNRQFKAVKGLSPSAFRAKYQEAMN